MSVGALLFESADLDEDDVRGLLPPVSNTVMLIFRYDCALPGCLERGHPTVISFDDYSSISDHYYDGWCVGDMSCRGLITSDTKS